MSSQMTEGSAVSGEEKVSAKLTDEVQPQSGVTFYTKYKHINLLYIIKRAGTEIKCRQQFFSFLAFSFKRRLFFILNFEYLFLLFFTKINLNPKTEQKIYIRIRRRPERWRLKLEIIILRWGVLVPF